MQEKTDRLTETAQKLDLKINTRKTKLIKTNHNSNDSVTINNSEVDEVNEFTYLRSKVATDGDSEREVNSRITKANHFFAMLKNIWKSKQVGTNTKLRFFSSNVLGVLLYGAECYKLTTRVAHKIETFLNKCLQKILGMFWPRRISNEELHQKTNAKSLTQTVEKRRWRWLCHVCRMPPDALPRIALRWTPDWKR